MAKKKKSKINLTSILIEAVLIFLSVYGAFLLEDKRTRDVNTKVLIGKLEQLKSEIRRDSLRFSDMLQPPEESLFKINIPATIAVDSMIIQHLLVNLPNRFELIRTYPDPWISIGDQWIAESPNYDFLLRNYLQNITLRDTEANLEAYFRTRRAIVEFNEKYRFNYERMTEYFDERIPLQSPEKTQREQISTPIWQNTMLKNYEILLMMKDLIETLLLKANTAMQTLESEIEAQS